MNGSGLTGTGNNSANTLVTVGANTLVGGDGNDSFVFYAGSSNGATVADFDGNGAGELDQLVFSGFGTEALGATIGQIGTTDQWQLHSGPSGLSTAYFTPPPCVIPFDAGLFELEASHALICASLLAFLQA